MESGSELRIKLLKDTNTRKSKSDNQTVKKMWKVKVTKNQTIKKTWKVKVTFKLLKIQTLVSRVRSSVVALKSS